MKYRADVDGLRAVAIVPVLLYHLGFPGFSGGYVGVDIFFVISGFLITSLLVGEAEAGRLSLARFYRRRILRLLPALFVVIAFCTLVAIVLLLPRDLRDFGRSLVASGLLSTNILFFLEAGYFDAPAHQKPLLHTWSLSVEEQFYLVFPLLLLALMRFFATHLRLVLAGLLVISLAASQWQLARDDTAAFFLPHFRAWELLVGVLIALTDWRRLAALAGAWMAATGLVLCLAPVFLFSRETPFPGFAALVPVLGATLVIAGGTGASPVSRALGHPAPVFVGKISYSLYLWHWPLAVFAGYYLVRELTLAEKFGILALSVGLAAASWRFVEQPFRRDRLPPRLVFVGAAAAAALVIGVGAWLHLTDGLRHRYPVDPALADTRSAYNPGTCFLDKRGNAEWPADLCTFRSPLPDAQPVVLWGDSYAAHFFPGLSALQRELPFDLTQITMAGCPPFLGEAEDRCGRFQRRAWAEIRERRPRLLIVSMSHWGGRGAGEIRLQVGEMIRFARQQGIRVLVIGESPIYAAPVPQVVEMLRRRGQDFRRFTPTNSFRTDAALRSAAAAEGADYFSVRDQLCREGRCALTMGDSLVAWDTGHLTVPASRHLVRRMKPLIGRALAPPPAGARSESSREDFR